MICQNNCNHDKCTFCPYIDKNIKGELIDYESNLINNRVYSKAEKEELEYINKLAEGIWSYLIQTYADKHEQE